MSADTRFHETVRRWKRSAPYNEVAAVLAVMLFGIQAAFLMDPVKEVLDEVEDWWETREADPIMKEAERQRVEKIVKQSEEAEVARRRLGPVVAGQVLHHVRF